MSSIEETVLRPERTYDGSAEEVFDAWTNPEVLRRWWVVNPDWRTPVADVDLREGGAYRLSMEDPATGVRHTVKGEYREIRRPELLVYSWSWESDDGTAGHESTVRVQFHSEGERTTVVLEHAGLEDAGSSERHGHGWKACMEMLGRRVFAASAQ